VAIIVIINTASTTKTHKSPVAIRPPNPNTNHINKRDTQNGRRSPTHAHNQYPYTQHSMQQNKEQKAESKKEAKEDKKRPEKKTTHLTLSLVAKDKRKHPPHPKFAPIQHRKRNQAQRLRAHHQTDQCSKKGTPNATLMKPGKNDS
jgi:hypothetical protein